MGAGCGSGGSGDDRRREGGQTSEPAPAPRVERFPVPAGTGPHDVAPAADGTIWYTAQKTGKLGPLDPVSGKTTEVPLGESSAPHGVIVGPDTAAWITDSGLNAIVRVDAVTNEVKRFPLPAERRGASLDCALLVEALAAAEKTCTAARLRAAARAGACGAHKERGFARAADWLASVSGSSSGSAKTALDTVAALEELPAAKAALEAGSLSIAQAREIVKAEASCPGSESGLLETATVEGFKTLKEEVRDRRLRALDPEELHSAQLQAQDYRHWRTALGTVVMRIELPPETGIPAANWIEAETDRLWRERRREAKAASGDEQQPALDIEGEAVTGRRGTLAAEAFLRLMNSTGKGRSKQADLVIVCDLRAYRRGHALDGEPCHLVGGGPIPVSLARELGNDAFLKAVLHDGTDISTVAHFGRRTSAVLRTALLLGGPPSFDGVKCSVSGCDRQLFYLERDHIDPVANGGLTALRNLQSLCFFHHRVKTEKDRKAGRLQRRKHQPSRSPSAIQRK